MSASKENKPPVISSLEPDSAVVTWVGFVQIGGNGFDGASCVLFDDNPVETTFRHDGLLEAKVTQTVTGTIGIKRVRVRAGNGTLSDDVSFLVVPG